MQIENNDRQKEMNVLMRDMQLRLETGEKPRESSDAEEDPIVVTPSRPSVDFANGSVEEVIVEPPRKTGWLSRWTKRGPAIRFDPQQNALKFYIARGE